jgi:ABC-type antimicrobial peptide transport system permease subunit
LLALLGGLAGFFAGSVLARQIGRSIFNSAVPVQPVLFPLVLALAVAVTFAGSAGAIRKAMQFDPVFALRGDA